jgi:Dullard-like phosphatase family protein
MEHCDDADFSFPVFFDMKEHVVYVRKRPHLHMFLQKMAEMFDVVIFTASQSVYADQLLDRLDPEKKLFSRRFFRESCVFTESGYTKDLTVIGVDLAKVAIIDNTPQVNCYDELFGTSRSFFLRRTLLALSTATVALVVKCLTKCY